MPWRVDPNTTTGAPEWSAFREASFGVAQLTVHNSTHAYFAWHRHACGSDQPSSDNMNFSETCSTPGDNSEQAMETSDVVWFVRPSADECSNRWVGSSYQPVNPFAASEDSASGNDDDDYSDREVALIALCSCFSFVILILLGTILYLTLIKPGPKRENENLVGREVKLSNTA